MKVLSGGRGGAINGYHGFLFGQRVGSNAKIEVSE